MNNFKFHSVGQGLFYTGSLANKTFNFVYDCGTDSDQCYLKSSIDAYVNEIQEPKTNKSYIDFVVISHLHRDHFSGLLELAQKTKIRKVYLPYLGHDTNLITLVLAYTIFGNGKQRVIDDTSYVLFEFMCGLYGIVNDAEYPRIEREFFKESNNNYQGHDDYCYYVHKDCAYIEAQNYWEFVFINKALNKDKIGKLNQKVSNLLYVYGVNHVIELVSLKGGIKQIAEYYKEVFFDEIEKDKNFLNETSITMIHYPLYKYHKAFYFDPNVLTPSAQRRAGAPRLNLICYGLRSIWDAATILSGDVTVDFAIEKIMSSVLKQSKNKSRSICGILQVPHHGSKYNWYAWIKTAIDSQLYVIPFGLGNKYRHPSMYTMDNLISSNKSIQLVNQMQSFEYYID